MRKHCEARPEEEENLKVIADDQFRPNKIDEDNLKIFDDSIVIPLKVIGCNLTADEILKEWAALEKNGFPLIHISRLLVSLQLRDTGQSLPTLIHLIKIIDAIHYIRLIGGGNLYDIIN